MNNILYLQQNDIISVFLGYKWSPTYASSEGKQSKYIAVCGKGEGIKDIYHYHPLFSAQNRLIPLQNIKDIN